MLNSSRQFYIIREIYINFFLAGTFLDEARFNEYQTSEFQMLTCQLSTPFLLVILTLQAHSQSTIFTQPLCSGRIWHKVNS